MNQWRPCLVLFFLLMLVTGIIYPLLVLGAGQAWFPYQAQGSLIRQGGKIIGSELIGQAFTSDRYFHPRPSAAGSGYDASRSAASNLGPSSPALLKAVAARVANLRGAGVAMPIPVDLVTSSASGLDPDISPAAAQFQAPRVAAARHLDIARVKALIAQNTAPPTFGILGEARVNVLALNRALDRLAPPRKSAP